MVNVVHVIYVLNNVALYTPLNVIKQNLDGMAASPFHVK
jgi:hypothetical protein